MKYFKHPMYALLLLIPALGMSLFMMSAPAFASYTCGTPNDTNPHCYAKYAEYTNVVTPPTGVSSYNFSTFYGGYTYDDVESITESGDQYAILNNEMWLEDVNLNQSTWHVCYHDFSNGAYSNPTALCWVEAGYQKVGTGYTKNTNAGHEAWFTSYVLPLDGANPNTNPVTLPYCDPNGTGACAYTNIYGTQLQSGDYNVFGDIEVAYDTVTAHQMDTSVDSAVTYYGVAIPNVYLNPTEIDTGTELGGTSGTTYPKTHFKHNQYELPDGTWHYQTNDGYVSVTPSTSILQGGWQTGGSYKPSNNTTGGVFDTCMQSGCTI